MIVKIIWLRHWRASKLGIIESDFSYLSENITTEVICPHNINFGRSHPRSAYFDYVFFRKNLNQIFFLFGNLFSRVHVSKCNLGYIETCKHECVGIFLIGLIKILQNFARVTSLLIHTTQNGQNKWTKTLTLEITIFGLKMIVKSGLEFFILQFTKPLQRYLLTCQANSAFLGSSNSEGAR